MIVLSLFDGIACGLEAIKRIGIKVDKYYTSEIDKSALQIANKNHPEIINLGDINNWERWGIGKVDMIIAGSPCQGFSFAGKQLNFSDERSKLFFKFVDILNYYKPKYFLLENVKMKKEYQDTISRYLGVNPVLINSALVSAQNRNRLYWCNWEITQPDDKGILLKDIIHENSFTDTEKAYCIDHSYYKGGDLNQYFNKYRRQVIFEVIQSYIVPFEDSIRILDIEVKKNKIGYYRNDSQANRIYTIHGKSVTLCGSAGGLGAKMGSYLFGCITPNRINKRQNWQRFNDGKKFYTLTAQDKHGILIEGYIRKLTPIECERLQTIPDNYTAGISDNQRYKCLGNGWTVDVITHILKELLKR